MRKIAEFIKTTTLGGFLVLLPIVAVTLQWAVLLRHPDLWVLNRLSDWGDNWINEKK